MQRQKRKGIILIMTLMSVCLVFMMINVLTSSSTMGLFRSSTFYDREAALQAAYSGVDYAVTRLQTNLAWRGDSNCKYWNGAELQEKSLGSLSSGCLVSESYGNVVGLLTNKAGTKSAFRIKFSYEDNSEDTYSRASLNRFGKLDTQEMMPRYSIASPYVSVNNLNGQAAVLVYRANNSGKGIAAETVNLEGAKNDSESERGFSNHLPGQRLCLIVEGVSGKDLRDCRTIESVNKVLNSNNSLVHRYVESYYTSNAPVFCGDSAFAKGDLVFNLKNKLYVATKGIGNTSDASVSDDLSTVPLAGSLRSCGSSVKVNGGKLNTYNGKVVCSNGGSAVFEADTDSYEFLDSEGKKATYKFPNTAIEKSDDTVETIEWDDVAKADSGNDNKMTAGFYQWHKAANSTADTPSYELRYYPGGYKLDSKGRPEPNSADTYQLAVTGDVPVDDPGVVVDGKTVQKMSIGPDSKISFNLDEDCNICEPVLNLAGQLHCGGDLVISSDVSEITDTCPKVLMSSFAQMNAEGQIVGTPEQGVLQADGDIFIASTLLGSGAVVTQTGDVTFMGKSLLEAGNSGVAVYAENVNLKSLSLALDKAPNGKSMNQSQSDKTGFVINEDGSKNLTFGPTYFNMLHESWCKNNYYTPSIPDVVAYFKDYYGVRANVMGISSIDVTISDNQTKRRYEIDGISFRDSSGKYVGDTYNLSITSLNEVTLTNANTHCAVSSMLVPKGAVVSTTTPPFDEEQTTEAETFGDVCYGDQEFSGIIYARKNFNADLGDDYNLKVTGAIRAETGNVKATCNNSQLTYDESCLQFLLPGYSALTRLLWTCW